MLEKIKSRKFILVVATALLTILNDGLGLGIPREAVLTVTGLIASYVLGQGMVDAAEKKAGGGAGTG